MLRTVMESVLQCATPEPDVVVQDVRVSRVTNVRPEESKLLCTLADGRHLTLSRLLGSNLRVGDEVSATGVAESTAKEPEIYIHKPSVRKTDVYQTKISYAALPSTDKRGDLFVRIEVVESQLGIRAIHIPCTVIRDYFFAANRNSTWSRQPSFYYLLHLPPDVTFKELRLGYRIRRMELMKENASKTELATIERAYNMLADPDLRAVYNELRNDPTTAVPFPYSGFGSLIVRGERDPGGVFFANRILAFLPERRQRKVPVPLRKLDYFDDYAILRDRNRRLEVLIDHQLLPLRWDPTWSQWRQHISATVEISAEFIHTGRYRKRRGEWKLIEWDIALPSRTELELPEGVEKDILEARRTHTRFGRYWREIDILRKHVEYIPTERKELSYHCTQQGLPGDFDVAQLTWRPDYDAYYYDQLNQRARTMFVFRDEYIFDLERSVVVEMPKAGHATYVFAKPGDVGEWVWDYAKTTRHDIRLNRDNVAESLGFRGRVVHGKSKTEWLRDLQMKIGEPPATGTGSET
jgi:hypothetical protein